jgi:hypothetical protein
VLYNTLMALQALIMITGMIAWAPVAIMMNPQLGVLILIASLTALNGLRQEANLLTKEK